MRLPSLSNPTISVAGMVSASRRSDERVERPGCRGTRFRDLAIDYAFAGSANENGDWETVLRFPRKFNAPDKPVRAFLLGLHIAMRTANDLVPSLFRPRTSAPQRVNGL